METNGLSPEQVRQDKQFVIMVASGIYAAFIAKNPNQCPPNLEYDNAKGVVRQIMGIADAIEGILLYNLNISVERDM